MNNTIEYDIREGVINLEYIGIITEPRDESYRFEDFRITPKTIQNIDAHIRNDSPLEYPVFDCHDEAGCQVYGEYGSEVEHLGMRTKSWTKYRNRR